MKVVSILILTVAGIIFVISLAISVQSFGIDQGRRIGEMETEETLRTYNIDRPQFSADGLRTYVYLSEKYGFICLYIALALGSGLISRLNIKFNDWSSILFSSMGILGSALSLSVLYGMIRDNSFVATWVWEVPRNAFAKMTIGYDWFFVIMIGTVLLLQLILISRQVTMGVRSRK